MRILRLRDLKGIVPDSTVGRWLSWNSNPALHDVTCLGIHLVSWVIHACTHTQTCVFVLTKHSLCARLEQRKPSLLRSSIWSG